MRLQQLLGSHINPLLQKRHPIQLLCQNSQLLGGNMSRSRQVLNLILASKQMLVELSVGGAELIGVQLQIIQKGLDGQLNS